MASFILSFLAAVFIATRDAISKKGLKDMNEYVIAWASYFFALPFLLPLLFFIEIPSLGEHFWSALFVYGALNIITMIMYMKAIKVSDLSITLPMLTFTPAFLLITSPLIVGEFPGIYGVIGILLIVIGSYLLNIKRRVQGYFAPFKALLSEKGPRLMLIVAFIWSITANLEKVGLLNSSTTFWPIALSVFIALLMFPIMFYKSKENIKQIPNSLNILLPIGLFAALMFISQTFAFSLTLVPYVVSIKRTSAIISVIFGYLIFKEKEIKERLLGATIMVLGVLFITLF